jgi:hypothetical protein
VFHGRTVRETRRGDASLLHDGVVIVLLFTVQLGWLAVLAFAVWSWA